MNPDKYFHDIIRSMSYYECPPFMTVSRIPVMPFGKNDH